MADEVEDKKGGGFGEIIRTIFWALVIAGVFRTFLYQPFWIPSGSMKDTLLVGDYLFINKMAYGYSRFSCPFEWMCPIGGRILGSEPKRGDVVVFSRPGTGETFVKRLIGLPGDRVQMKNGLLYLNDEPVKVEPMDDFVETMAPQGPQGDPPHCANAPVPEGGECRKARARETLPGGVSHDILNIFDATGLPDNTPAYTVPEGEYFFMGDNRDNSADSRFSQREGGVGFVPFDRLMGRVDFVLFSSSGRSLFAFWTWRADRFLKAIH